MGLILAQIGGIMGRPKKAPDLDSQLKSLITQSLEEKQFMMAQRLMKILEDRNITPIMDDKETS